MDSYQRPPMKETKRGDVDGLCAATWDTCLKNTNKNKPTGE